MSKQILIVEDEPKLAASLEEYLTSDGFHCHWIHNGGIVVEWVRTHSPDLILLDIKLPQQDGISLCKEIRAFSSIPIFMITSQVTEKDRLVGLSIGADDYICKPYIGKEVVARVKSFFRRQDVLSKTWITSKGFHLNEENLQIHYNGNLLDLTLCEYRVLATLLKKSGKVYSRTELIDALHEDEREILNRTVDSHIKNLRHKLNKISPNKDIIQSVYGAGYKISID